jgi:hypothetical protein
MQPTCRAMHSRTGRGLATSEQTWSDPSGAPWQDPAPPSLRSTLHKMVSFHILCCAVLSIFVVFVALQYVMCSQSTTGSQQWVCTCHWTNICGAWQKAIAHSPVLLTCQPAVLSLTRCQAAAGQDGMAKVFKCTNGALEYSCVFSLGESGGWNG